MNKQNRKEFFAIDLGNDRHRSAVGARMIWRHLSKNGISGRLFATICIKMQTYY